MKHRAYDLEERLIEFALMALEVCENLPTNYGGQHLGKQLTRSGTSPALNYGEAQAAESKKDFIHKMGIVLKELRESKVCLILLLRKGYTKREDVLAEAKELVAIFGKSIDTAKRSIKS